MGFKQVPGSDEVLVHEDGRVRLGLRNIPKDSQRLQWPTDKTGNKKNEWPTLIIKVGYNEPERKMLLPEAIMKTHGELPSQQRCAPEDFTPKNDSRTRMQDAALDNLEYSATGNNDDPVKSTKFIDKPENRKEKQDEEKPEPKAKTKPKEDAPDKDVPTANADAKDVSEGVAKLRKGSAELTAKEAIQIIEDYDFEELRDLDFYTEEERDRPRTTVIEAWEKKLEEFQKD